MSRNDLTLLPDTMKLNDTLRFGALLLGAAAIVGCCKKQATETPQEDPYPVPDKAIEEMCYTPEKTTFEVWGPTAESAIVRLYDGDLLVEASTSKSPS